MGRFHRACYLDDITPERSLRDTRLGNLQTPLHEGRGTGFDVCIKEGLRIRVVRIGNHERWAGLRKRDEKGARDGQLSPKERVVNASWTATMLGCRTRDHCSIGWKAA